ncbi:MAG: alpha/beta fold hydrolase [Acidobacteriota bacterium]
MPEPPTFALPSPTADDRPRAVAPPRLFLALEARAFAEGALGALAAPWLLEGPRGDGHRVVVLPGFLASDLSTRPLRGFLRRMGYDPVGWGLGRNLGLRTRLEEELVEQIEFLADQSGGPVSVIGWSLGGVYARWVANETPASVRSVITLGSPFADDPRANHAWRLFERISPRSLGELEPHQIDMIQRNPPVPTTSIYSRTDGVAAWRCSVTPSGERAENIEVHGSHFGLGVNPLVLHAITDRLAQPEGGWRPFRRHGLRRVFYPRPIAPNAHINGATRAEEQMAE